MVSFTYPARTKKLLILLKKIKIPQAKKSLAIAKAKHEKSVFKNGLTLVGLSILKVPRKAVQRRSKKVQESKAVCVQMK